MTNKNKNPLVATILDENDQIVTTEEVGVPTLFQPTDWDVAEELQNNEALLDFQRENMPEY